MEPLYFIIILSTSGINPIGITSGYLGYGNDAPAIRAAYQLNELKKEGKDAHLFRIQKSQNGSCDWGCEYPVYVSEVEPVEIKIPPVPESSRIELRDKGE